MENTAPDLQQVRAEAAEAERSRIAGISALCSKHDLEDMGRQLIEGGRSIDEARAAVLEKLGVKPVETVKPVELEQRDHSDYQIADGLRAMLTGDWSSRGAGLVRELRSRKSCAALALLPALSVLSMFRSCDDPRDLCDVNGANAGGNFVETDLDSMQTSLRHCGTHPR